jgi:uncharacterized protein YciI
LATYFAVFREPGPAWARGRSRAEQDAWDAHAAFMNALAESGFIVLGGPVGDVGPDNARTLLIVDAASAQEIERRLAEDPWSRMGLLRLVSVEPWLILLDRQASVQPGDER